MTSQVVTALRAVVGFTVSWFKYRPVWAMKGHRFRTLNLARTLAKAARTLGIAEGCSRLFPARGTAKGPQRRAKGTAGDALRGFTRDVQALELQVGPRACSLSSVLTLCVKGRAPDRRL
jgi:hypothetical protein